MSTTSTTSTTSSSGSSSDRVTTATKGIRDRGGHQIARRISSSSHAAVVTIFSRWRG
jgi:hypothetical protein